MATVTDGIAGMAGMTGMGGITGIAIAGTTGSGGITGAATFGCACAAAAPRDNVNMVAREIRFIMIVD
jgi:hypothetical protein